MTSKSILCIVEGEVTEVKILNKLNQEYIGRNIDFLPICTNIYHFYHAYLQEVREIGDDIDIFLFLKQFDKKEILKDKEPEDFLGIYLFMDLDKHEPLAKDYLNCIPDMLDIFDNHSENGKLYISYPMVEAFQHSYHENQLFNFQKIGNFKKYKKMVVENTLSELKCIDDLHCVDSVIIENIMINNIKQVNKLIDENFSFPLEYQIDNWSQLVIYANQFEKYIQPNNEVLVLSPFALFLLEYLGEKLFLEWQAIDNH